MKKRKTALDKPEETFYSDIENRQNRTGENATMINKLAVWGVKGGLGKSTSSLELAAGLQKRGFRTLLMDMDCQGSASFACGLDIEDTELKTLKNVLDGEDIRNVICHNTPFGDIVPDNLKLFTADQTYTQLGAVKKVRKAVECINDDYDFIIFDCPPAAGFTTLSALTAADYILVPQLASMFSLISLRNLETIYTLVKEEANPGLKVLGIFLTKYNPRTRFSKDLEANLKGITKELFNAPVFDTKIRNAIAVEESFATRKDIFDYAPRTKIAEDFNSLVEEVLLKLNVPAEKETE